MVGVSLCWVVKVGSGEACVCGRWGKLGVVWGLGGDT